MLQEERVLAETPPEQADALAALLARLYGAPQRAPVPIAPIASGR